MNRKGIIGILGGLQVLLGLAVFWGAAIFSLTYAGHVRTATTAFGAASLSFGEQVNLVVATVESNRDFTLKLGQAVGTYRKLTQQVKQQSITVAKSLPDFERSVLSLADNFRTVSATIDKVADWCFVAKYPTGWGLEYTEVVAGVRFPTKVTYRMEVPGPVSRLGGEVRDLAKFLSDVEITSRKSADTTFPEAYKTHKAVVDACDKTDAALTQVEDILAKADKEELPRSLDQMRRAGAALSDAGRSLTEGVTPVLWWTAAGVAVLGILTMCNGIMLLCLTSGAYPAA